MPDDKLLAEVAEERLREAHATGNLYFCEHKINDPSWGYGLCVACEQAHNAAIDIAAKAAALDQANRMVILASPHETDETWPLLIQERDRLRREYEESTHAK